MPEGWMLLATDDKRPIAWEKQIGSFRLTVARDLARADAWNLFIDRNGTAVAHSAADAFHSDAEAARAAEMWAQQHAG